MSLPIIVLQETNYLVYFSFFPSPENCEVGFLNAPCNRQVGGIPDVNRTQSHILWYISSTHYMPTHSPALKFCLHTK